MKAKLASVLIAAACLGAAACRLPSLGGKAKAPVGEVVATADGQEVTLRDLRAELAGVRTPADPSQTKQMQEAALQRILVRRILAKTAHDQGLDKTPDFAIQKERVMDDLLARSLEAKFAATAPAPTREEAESFMASHPDIFAERKIFVLDQIRIARPSDARLLAELKPLNTLDDIAALLTREHVAFQRGTARLDAVGADPKLVAAILKLPPKEVFVMPVGGLVLISQVKDTQVEPFTGEPAITYALNALKNQRQQEAVSGQVNAILRKARSSVTYNKAYQPSPPAPQRAAAPAAGAGNVG